MPHFSRPPPEGGELFKTRSTELPALLELALSEKKPDFYRDLAPHEKPLKSHPTDKKPPNGQKKRNGFLITEKTAFWMCV
jgi:hypothetical protein